MSTDLEPPAAPAGPDAPGQEGGPAPAAGTADPRADVGWVTPSAPRVLDLGGRLVRLPGLVLHNLDLVRTTLRRDLSARFQGTLFGWAWPFIQPLFLFGVYYFIFSELLNQKMPNLPEDQKAAMGVYMFCGMIVWAALAESLARGTSVIVDNGNLIKKLAFPSELLPLNVVLASMVMMLFAVVIFVLSAWFTPVWPAPSWSLLWIPPLCLVQAVFCYGLVLLASTLHVFLRDTLQIVTMITTVWMFLTPIFWVPELVGAEQYEHVIELNPTYHMIAAWRGALMGDVAFPLGERVIAPVAVARIPEHLARFGLWALASYAVGYGFFVLSQRRFADEV